MTTQLSKTSTLPRFPSKQNTLGVSLLWGAVQDLLVPSGFPKGLRFYSEAQLPALCRVWPLTDVRHISLSGGLIQKYKVDVNMLREWPEAASGEVEARC